ncbi:MAG: rhomboid family intramembrane serine protease [Candidatus Kariarchaeaceae archaeon]|jgi:rhomboid protease GluP
MAQSNRLLPEEWEGPTVNLAITNILFYLITILVGGNLFLTGDAAIKLFGFSIDGLSKGFLWTIITCNFVHADIAHLGFNMLFLLIFGTKLEELGLSNNAIYFAYLTTGIFSSIISLYIFFFPVSISLGASGAVFGLLGVNAGIEKQQNNPNFKRVLFLSIILFIFSSGQNTNVFAHLFGLIMGFVLGYRNFHLKFESYSMDHLR